MTETSPPATLAVLAFDFGTRRIGVALGNTLLRTAHPLATIDSDANDARFSAIEKLIREWQPGQLVVGIPVHADGTPHAVTARARRFARQLAGRFGLAVAEVDERHTTVEASLRQAARGDGGRKGRSRRDAAAAQVILQDWFDARQPG